MIYCLDLKFILQVILYIHLSILSSNPLSLLSRIVIVIEMVVLKVHATRYVNSSSAIETTPLKCKTTPNILAYVLPVDCTFIVRETLSSYTDLQAKIKDMTLKLWFSYFAHILEVSILRVGGLQSELKEQTKTCTF